MKTIGLIGGMSWESTVPYYTIINEYVKNKLGGLHSARIILYSVEFDEIEKCQTSGDWDKSARILGDAAAKLEAAGADMILICTNTMHKVAPQVQEYIRVPLIHIADATADELLAKGVRRVALLGTKYTMTQDFYVGKLKELGLEVLVPEGEDIEIVNRIIFEELCVGLRKEESRREFCRIIKELKDRGAEAVILGCTEIGLLVRPEDSVLPVFDTTKIHAEKCAELALEEELKTLLRKEDSYSIANTTKQERIELIRSWAGEEDDGPDGCEVDLWEMYRDYIDGKKEIAECNAAFRAEYYEETGEGKEF